MSATPREIRTYVALTINNAININLAQIMRSIHNQIILQAYAYSELSVALTGKIYSQHTMQQSGHIHSV